MTMSHHIFFTSGGAAYNVELSVSAASISFASLDTAIDVAAYTDEDTATVNLLAPAPSWSREVVKTPPGRDIRSQEEAPYREAVHCAPRFRCQHCPHKIVQYQARFSLLLPMKVLSIIPRAVGVVARLRN